MEGAVLFSEQDADKIIDFALSCKDVDTLLVHCYGRESRSRAVAAFVVKMYGKDNSYYFATGNPNEHIYNTLLKTWNNRKDKIKKCQRKI